ncbi:MAG: SUMF1/EgtB/PvdO family nonheme iron enzyme [Burkholderiaceae bacterium]|nr:SUMF1/EgtB/PvdO family nonheme iron enzyme [Burkholderiaceae bacterium]
MIFTFYSFKGGVGRSMALADVAWELASRGLRVLAIDFDLEAPGLERYFDVAVEAVHARRGVIDQIEAFKSALAGSGSMGEDAGFRQLADFIHPKVADFQPGRLDLMPAGLRDSADHKRAYALAVRTFDWQDFYFNWEGQAYFEWLRRSLVGDGELQYDVVLADSRTGVTEMGGVCACQLADVVVMLSAPNHQNVEGTRELAADLLSEPVQRLRRGRPPLQIVVVPARVEQRVPALLQDFERRFDEVFRGYRPDAHVALGLRTHDIALPYVPEFAFDEQVTRSRGAGAGPLHAQYQRLADALLVLCGDGATPALREAAAAARARLGAQDPGAVSQLLHGVRAFDPTRRSAGVDAYLSCARDARGRVQELLAALEHGGRRLHSEFTEAEAFGAETDLPLTATEQLRHAEALVLFADAMGLRPWQRGELKAARSLPRPPAIVQVLLPGAAADAFTLAFGESLRECPLIDLRRWPDDRAGLWLLAEAVRPAGAAETQAAAAAGAADIEPFPGLAPYAEQHAAFFLGRQGELDALRTLVTGQRRVVLAGPSGAGKTSLVRAGLFPALRGSSTVRELRHVDLGRPPAEPGAATTWLDGLPALRALPAATLVVLDHADEAGAELMQAIADWWAATDGPRLLLVWREAPLALAEAEVRRRWEAEAAGTDARADHPLHHRCSWGAAAEALIAQTAKSPRVELAPLEAQALRAAVESALAQSGRRAEAGLIERLFTDAGTPVAAATVQRMLATLWQQQSRGWLTNEAYDRSGGIDRQFVTTLDDELGSVPGADHEALNAWLLRLMRRADDGTILLRPFSWARSVTQPVFGGRAAALVQRLAAAGLVVIRRQRDDALVELAHRPRDWVGLDPLRQSTAAWRPKAHTIAAAYAAWADGGLATGADAVLGDADLAALAPHLSQGELAFALRRQVSYRRERRIKAVVQGAFFLVVAGAIGLGILQSRVRDQAERDAASLAITAARSQTDQAAQQAALGRGPDKASPADRSPAAVAALRVVAHRSGVDETDARLADALLARLPVDRFRRVGTIERVQQPICGDVRVHHERDLAAARQVADTLNAALAQAGDLRRLQLNDRRDAAAAAEVEPGTIEVWLPPLTDAPPQREHRWGESRLVSAGCALVGSDAKARDTLRRGLNAPAVAWYDSELAPRREWLAAFYIGRTEVTAAAFAEYQRQCEQQRGSACPPWKPLYLDPQREGRRPATFVSWTQAGDYCRWAGGRLPTDLEWEKAARGPDGRFWPWGDLPDDRRFQGKTRSPDRPVDVGSFPAGDSPYGVADMAGNVWEFTADLWDGSSHSMRGGSYLNTLMESRASVRWASGREAAGTESLGFRCVAAVGG